jgi:hypothetical protein
MHVLKGEKVYDAPMAALTSLISDPAVSVRKSRKIVETYRKHNQHAPYRNQHALKGENGNDAPMAALTCRISGYDTF